MLLTSSRDNPYLMNNLTRTNQMFWTDRPAQFQTRRRECFSSTTDGHGSLPHVRQGGHTNVFLVRIVSDPFVDFIRDADHVVLLTQCSDVFQFVTREDFPNRIVRRVDNDQSSAGIEHRFEFFLIEDPISAGWDLRFRRFGTLFVIRGRNTYWVDVRAKTHWFQCDTTRRRSSDTNHRFITIEERFNQNGLKNTTPRTVQKERCEELLHRQDWERHVWNCIRTDMHLRWPEFHSMDPVFDWKRANRHSRSHRLISDGPNWWHRWKSFDSNESQTYKSSCVLMKHDVRIIQRFLVEVNNVGWWRIIDESLSDIHSFVCHRQSTELDPEGKGTLHYRAKSSFESVTKYFSLILKSV